MKVLDVAGLRASIIKGQPTAKRIKGLVDKWNVPLYQAGVSNFRSLVVLNDSAVVGMSASPARRIARPTGERRSDRSEFTYGTNRSIENQTRHPYGMPGIFRPSAAADRLVHPRVH
jgi:hypothetical protein